MTVRHWRERQRQELGQPTAEYPHCDIEVLHAPGVCVYCDFFPEWQAERASNTPCYACELSVSEWHTCSFTPREANGWWGNVAQSRRISYDLDA
jgi:hypothetical protein